MGTGADSTLCVAILQVDEPSTWKVELDTRLQLPALHFEVEHRLQTILLTKEMQNEPEESLNLVVEKMPAAKVKEMPTVFLSRAVTITHHILQ